MRNEDMDESAEAPCAGGGLEKRPLRLDQLRRGQCAVVACVTGTGAIQQRILEMGVCRGASVTVIRFAPLGDPMVIQVRGSHLTMRKSEAALVELEPEA